MDEWRARRGATREADDTREQQQEEREEEAVYFTGLPTTHTYLHIWIPEASCLSSRVVGPRKRRASRVRSPLLGLFMAWHVTLNE